MENNVVKLMVSTATYQRMQEITEALNQGEKQSLSKDLGQVLTELTCEVLEQVFGILLQQQSFEENSHIAESTQVLEQIHQYLHQYMPWSIGLFSNQRLQSVANYMCTQLEYHHDDKIFLCYELDKSLAMRLHTNIHALMQGEIAAIEAVFKDLIAVIDAGVTAHIRIPKSMLKFNFLVDKTLTGIIHVVTNMGYKRIEKIAKYADITQAQHYVTHFYSFVQK